MFNINIVKKRFDSLLGLLIINGRDSLRVILFIRVQGVYFC